MTIDAFFYLCYNLSVVRYNKNEFIITEQNKEKVMYMKINLLKIILSFLLCFSITLGLSACQIDDVTDDNPPIVDDTPIEPTEIDKIGRSTVENMTGELNMLSFNNPDLLVDLGVGLWAQPVVVDMNKDGIVDLVVACNSVPYNGTYIFYGTESSYDSESENFLVLEEGRYFHGALTDFTASFDYNVIKDGDNYLYEVEKTYIMSGNALYTNFSSEYPTAQSVRLGVGVSYPGQVGKQDFTTSRMNSYSIVDYDGDGINDLIRFVGCWDEYNVSQPKFDANGVWGDDGDPVHGWIFWAKNNGSNEYPSYDKAKTVSINDDIKTPIDVYGAPSARFFDWDYDGDLDIICGSFLDDITYFQNIGTRTNPIYSEGVPILDNENNVLEMDLCMLTVTNFDINNDGLMDLVVGEEDGRVSYLENTGLFHNGAPKFMKQRFFQTKAANLKYGILNTPYLIDFDSDGDEDIISGNSAGYVGLIKNLSVEKGVELSNPVWDRPVNIKHSNGVDFRIIAGASGSIQGPAEEKWGYSAVSVADWDKDGILDIMVNTIIGTIVWLKGTEAGSIVFEEPRNVEVEWSGHTPKPMWNWWNPQGKELVVQWRTTPVMIDINKDGLMDLVVPDKDGYMSFFERYLVGGVLKLKEGNKIFKLQSGGDFRFNAGINGGSGRTNFTMCDFDGDGKIDMLRNDSVNISFWKNVSPNEGGFSFINMGSIGTRKIASHSTAPGFCDFNLDGKLDLVIGAEDGHFYYYENKLITEEEDDNEVRENLNSYLVTHWDFEGVDANALNDKATFGATADTLTLYNTVSIENGIAVITNNGGLKANNSADLFNNFGFTILMKVKITGTHSGYFSIFDKRSFASTPTWGEKRSYSLLMLNNQLASQVTSNGLIGTAAYAESGVTVINDTWIEIAYVVEKNSSGIITIKGYMSKNDNPKTVDDYIAFFSYTTGLTSLYDSPVEFTLGNEIGLPNVSTITRSFDDVRFYNTALNLGEIISVYP